MSATAEALSEYNDKVGVVSIDMIKPAGRQDHAYSLLGQQIIIGFPQIKHLTDPTIREYWEVRNRLAVSEGLVIMDRRIVIPAKLRKRILQCLHSAHQGGVRMKSRANETVYWPGETCETCNRIAPSQAREPIVLSESPQWPFQKIVMDLFLLITMHTWLVRIGLPAG